MTKRKNIAAVITMIIVFGSLLFGIISTQVIRNEIRKNGIIIPNCYIVGVYKQYQVNSYSFECIFVFNNKKINLTGWSRARSSIRKNADEYLNHYFPGAYSERYNRMELLMLPDDFANYGLPYPDSLRWVDSLNRGLKNDVAKTRYGKPCLY